MPKPTPHVLFRLGRQAFAVALSEVKDVARAPDITPVARAVPAIRGLTVSRDELATVLDLRARFGLPTQAQTGTVLMVEHEGERVGLLVDRVEDVLNLPPSQPTASAKDPLWQGVVSGIIHREQDIVVVLDVAGILNGVAA